jgi:hypothetical protein
MEYLCDGIYKGKAIVYTKCFRATQKIKHLPSINIPFTSLLVDPKPPAESEEPTSSL